MNFGSGDDGFTCSGIAIGPAATVDYELVPRHRKGPVVKMRVYRTIGSPEGVGVVNFVTNQLLDSLDEVFDTNASITGRLPKWIEVEFGVAQSGGSPRKTWEHVKRCFQGEGGVVERHATQQVDM